MTQPVETRAATLRVLGTNLTMDTALAVILVVLPAIQAEHVDWRLTLVSVAKTAALTALTGLQHWLRAHRAS